LAGEVSSEIRTSAGYTRRWRLCYSGEARARVQSGVGESIA
jgi:hypothetical protein